MILKPWHELPQNMQNEAVRPYYDRLRKKRINLIMKLCFDKIMSVFLLVILSPVFLVLAIMIKLDSPGEIMFRQERVTQYGRKFHIHKFRTMFVGADKQGTLVTIHNDTRVTRVGKLLRGSRMDELPQLIDIFNGDMSFVGTRPEVVKYVEQYTPEMLATLLLPAGVTSEASIEYKDEEKLMRQANNVDEVYVKIILPQKMKWNYFGLKNISLFYDIKVLLKTVGAVS
ncbi:sugar transferase [Selenomonas sputigena]|jgi:hypothetical protein|uniref:sugar transferase n=1 Tax=Selenomonas sputigena TaxID=69823 RepID=UPI0028E80514|nr:sugar transferase [Selenomonas sputigena]